MVSRVTSRLLDVVGRAISPLLEAVFDEVEYRFARRAIKESTRLRAESFGPERGAGHEQAKIESGRRA
jgi:hypothetical protein